jgi:hypothetical protein
MNEPPHLFPMNQIWDIVVSIEVSIPIESYIATVAEVSRLVLGAPTVVSSYHFGYGITFTSRLQDCL